MQQLLLIDATAYLFRAYHAVGDLRTSDGKPSGAIFGTLNMLDKLRRSHPDSLAVCVVDAPGKTFRHKIYKEYKATRPPAPPDLISQIQTLPQFIRALGLPLIAVSGVEADDVIATYTRQGSAAGMEVLIASSDKDLMQLVEDGQVNLYDGMRDVRYDRAAVQTKFGVPPEQIADYLALVGDSADNIPGVMKVGAKTAAKWLIHYGSLGALCEQAEQIKGKVGENLRAAIADGTLQLSRRLVALKEDVELPCPAEQLRPQPPDKKAWQRLCAAYEFKKLQTALDDGAESAGLKMPGMEIISDEAALQRWCDKIRQAGIVALDTETVGEPVMTATLVGVSLSITPDDAAYIPIAHHDLTAAQLPLSSVLNALRPLLEDAAISKIMHNGKYDWHVFANSGVRLAGTLEDTKIAAYVINSASDNTLKQLAQKWLGVDMTEYKDVVDGKKIANFAALEVDKAAAYSAEDAWVTRCLHDSLAQNLTPAAAKLYSRLDRPLMPLLAHIERAGMKIDAEELSSFADSMRQDMQRLENRAYEIADGEFNLNSPRQIAEILFDRMGAKPIKKTSGGARSTDERTLEKLANDFPLARVLLDYRTLAKLVGTYADKLPQEIIPATGRIHTSFNQTAVMSGRLSSSGPNLQNIPIKTEIGRRIRRAFIAEPGHCLLSADYSQIELRLMAHIAGDQALGAAFAAGADIHRQTASEVFGLPFAEVTDHHRRAAKAINFGLIYGMSAFGLARTIAVEQEQAQTYIERYFGRYPQVAAYMERTRAEGPTQGYVETILGRRIPLTVLTGNRQAIERVAINAPIQGSAADLMKQAMLAVQDYLTREKLPAQMILQVHDELVIEAECGVAEQLQTQLPLIMTQVAELTVPLEVQVGIGDNWDDAH